MFILKSCVKVFIICMITKLGSYVVKKGAFSSYVNEVKIQCWGKLVNIHSKVHYGGENILHGQEKE
jgi:hypothetical protein